MRLHIFLLKNARGCPSHDKTTPIATFEAPVSSVNILEKSGRTSARVVVIFSFNVVKAKSTVVLHINLVERNKSVSGAANMGERGAG
jgi:hypothetical protein